MEEKQQMFQLPNGTLSKYRIHKFLAKSGFVV